MPNHTSTVLIIEDEKPLNKVLQDNLEQGGNVQVHVAYDGAEGLKKAKTVQPDLILLDLVMPKMDGLEFLRRLRKNSNTKSTKVVVLSNVSEYSKLKSLRELGVYDFILKSNWNMEEVMERVRGFL
jgi:CheY-like chemotaxis protein